MSPNFPGRFLNQVAVVTGAATGLGQAIAARLLAEGAAVWFLDRDAAQVEAAVAKAGPGAHALCGDVTDEGWVGEAITRATEGSGRLDILVNSAGIVGPNNRRVADTPTEGFRQVFAVNLLGSFLVMKAALPVMERQRYGRVLMIASIAGKEGNAGMCSYSAMKAGVIGLVKSAGKEYAETGVTVNALAPAVIRTNLVEAMDPQQVRYMTDRIPMKRCGTLAEVAALACWIVSPEASFNTGFVFDLTGGRAVY
jgi:2-dehydro-3-deoxy-L-rhamnonate dehydrogenase (NAD+)